MNEKKTVNLHITHCDVVVYKHIFEEKSLLCRDNNHTLQLAIIIIHSRVLKIWNVKCD